MRKKILIAEDDPDIGDMVQLILEEAGYEVELQADGQVVQEMQEPFPDLLFLDIRLAGTDGWTICRQLKGNPATHHIPIILLSAQSGIQNIARDAGAETFLAKPFEMEELLALAAHYLGNQ
jgi:CheY-like chemotaxis protein